MSGRPSCRWPVYWWDCDLHASCLLPIGHDGPHFDGLRWYTVGGLQVPSEQRISRTRRVVP